MVCWLGACGESLFEGIKVVIAGGEVAVGTGRRPEGAAIGRADAFEPVGSGRRVGGVVDGGPDTQEALVGVLIRRGDYAGAFGIADARGAGRAFLFRGDK